MLKQMVIGFVLGYMILVTSTSLDMIKTLFISFDENQDEKLTR
jgi:hypothetical protein